MPSPLLQLRIPQDLADWLEAKYPSRGEVAEYVRQLLTAEQMKEAAAPLVPVDEITIFERCSKEGHVEGPNGGCRCGYLWSEDTPLTQHGIPSNAEFEEGAGFETPQDEFVKNFPRTQMPTLNEFDAHKAKPKARRKDVRKVPDQPVSVMNRGGDFTTTQEPSSKSVKGSPAMGSRDGSVGSNGQAAPPNKSAAESPSPKPRKPKTCQHSNIIRKLGQPFCTDCGEFVNG